MIEYKDCPLCGNHQIIPVLSAEDYTVSHEHFDIWECNQCSVRFTQNSPSPEDIGKYYQSENYISHSDTSTGLINNLYHRVRKRTLIRKKKLMERFTGKTAGSILDVGCGTGAFLHTMKQAGWEVTGLEPDENAAKKAKELYGIEPMKADEIYNLSPATFDAITMWHVLEHVHDLHGYMKKLKSLLKPGGKLFIAVPNYTSYDAAKYKQFWAAYDVPRHIYHFTKSGMEKLMNTENWKMKKIKPLLLDSFYISMLSEKYKKSAFFWLKGLVFGSISNFKASKTGEYSSLIYVIEKK